MKEMSGSSEMLAVTPVGATEGELIGEKLCAAIAALRERGMGKKAIARELGLDIKTVRRWSRESWRPQTRRSRGQELARWEAFLRARAPEVGFNAEVLRRELVEQGESCSYRAVARYIAPWRAQWRGDDEPTVRFETGPGEQSQVDWGSTWIYLQEERVRVHIFAMVLGYSRRLFAKAYLSEGLESLLDGHVAAFTHFGGRTETILYDNPRTIVTDKDEATGNVTWNATFKDRMDFYGVKIRLCRYYRARTKGKIESGVKYIKRNGLAGRRFRDLDELNGWLLRWCLEVADQRVHGTTHERPAERFARGEQLIAVDERAPTPRERVVTRLVPRDCFVAVEANRYPVPLDWSGSAVEVHLQSEEILITKADSDPVRHRRLAGKHQVARWEGPPRSMPRRQDGRSVGAPRFDPIHMSDLGDVAIRTLASYEELVEEVRS
jgi:transposase